MRVVAGRLRGRRLRTIPGQAVRPTSDRVKTCIFDILGDRVSGAMVLDLFAGSGALGIEALSRGAARVVFVDSSRRVLMALEENLQALGLRDSAEVVCSDVHRYLRRWQGEQPFDLAFADPPYDFSGYEALLGALAERRLLHPKGMLVLEHRKGLHLLFPAEAFELVRTREFGTTAVSWFVMRSEVAHEDRHLPRDV
ncbi:MAG: 16S rRNA (guanine(966)-N(2))-methyltransferase RsmD [Calditrichaeota bacterium]|nr:16S rRNA (guanine(966)-N(2))-methyltransferase RsmD [Calditrichota bacterium]